MNDTTIQAISTIASTIIGAAATIAVAIIQNTKNTAEKPVSPASRGAQVTLALPMLILIVVFSGVLSGAAGFYLSGLILNRSASLNANVEALLPEITNGPGGIQKAFPWWNEYSNGGMDGRYDPAALPGWKGCYGIAWNVIDYNDKVIVFQQELDLKFQPGGWYVQVCVPKEVKMTAYDVGKIQATWLSKEYRAYWDVEVLP